MAQRRMIHLKVSESNEFYKLPHGAQALYLHLNQNADDEGVVNNSRTIMLALRLKKSTLNELLNKNFIIYIEEKDILVIKHWYLGNTIQRDRFTQSTYHEDICKYLELGKDKVYRLKNGNKMETKCIQNGNKMYTQYSIGKDSIVEDSIEKDIREKENKEKNNARDVLKESNPSLFTDSDDEEENYSIPNHWDYDSCSKAVNLYVREKQGQVLTDLEKRYVNAYFARNNEPSASEDLQPDSDLPFYKEKEI